MKRVWLILAFVAASVVAHGELWAKGGGHGGHSHHGNSGGSKPSGNKTVHVRSYTRKDGTVVQSHYRSAPRTSTRLLPRTSARTGGGWSGGTGGAGGYGSGERDETGADDGEMEGPAGTPIAPLSPFDAVLDKYDAAKHILYVKVDGLPKNFACSHNLPKQSLAGLVPGKTVRLTLTTGFDVYQIDGISQPVENPSDEIERMASLKLKYAKEFLEVGKKRDAEDYLSQILNRYPKSKAAPEAKRILDDIRR